MMLPQKLNKLLDDWPSKLISLVAAILIYVFYQVSILETKNLAVPLSIQENGSFKAVSVSDKNVHVSIKGMKEDIVTLEALDFNTFIDISSINTEGEYELPVEIQLSSNATIIENLEVRVNPSTVKVNVTEYSSAFVPVISSFSGTPSHGYELGDVFVTPPAIKIYGPKKAVESQSQLFTELVSVNDCSESFVKETNVYSDNTMIEFPESSKVSVSVDIEKSITEKTYRNVPVYVMRPTEPYYMEDTEFYTDITIRGRVLALDSYFIPQNTFYIDCSSFEEEGSYVVAVKNSRISAGEVISIYPSDFSVRISKVEKTEETVEIDNPPIEEESVIEAITVTEEQGKDQ